jgi:hypothetical protein
VVDPSDVTPIMSVASDEPPESFDPTAGWQDLLSVLVLLVGGVVAALVAFAIGVWLHSRRVRLAEAGTDASENPSAP